MFAQWMFCWLFSVNFSQSYISIYSLHKIKTVFSRKILKMQKDLCSLLFHFQSFFYFLFFQNMFFLLFFNWIMSQNWNEGCFIGSFKIIPIFLWSKQSIFNYCWLLFFVRSGVLCFIKWVSVSLVCVSWTCVWRVNLCICQCYFSDHF